MLGRQESPHFIHHFLHIFLLGLIGNIPYHQTEVTWSGQEVVDMNVHGILKPPQNDQAHNGDNHQSQKEIFLDEENGSIVEDVEDGTFISVGFGATITHTITALDIGDDRIYAEYAHVHQ